MVDLHIPKGKLCPYTTDGPDGRRCVHGWLLDEGKGASFIGRAYELVSTNNGFWGPSIPGGQMMNENPSTYLAMIEKSDADWSDETRIRYIDAMKPFGLNIVFDGWDDPRKAVPEVVVEAAPVEEEALELVEV